MGENGATQYQVQGFDAVVCSESMRRLMQMVERVARANASVLITGETGSGKEFIARALHHHSLRCSKPWIDLNCAALPEHLVESELFGYEKGAFSGADAQKQGLFELANGGTLFLDEIGELEPKVQVKLLRVLDGVPYYRLGGNKKVGVDVRIIAATNQDLESASKPDASAAIFIIASDKFSYAFRLCASVLKTSKPWPISFCNNIVQGCTSLPPLWP